MSHVFGRILAVLGVILLIVAVIFLVISLAKINFVYLNPLMRGTSNPAYQVAAAAGLALVAGLLLGLGLAYGTRRVKPTITDRPVTPPR